MLILTRKINEKIIIGNDITLSVLDVKGNQVRLGIEAPKDISVHREEIYNKIEQEKELLKPVYKRKKTQDFGAIRKEFH